MPPTERTGTRPRTVGVTVDAPAPEVPLALARAHRTLGVGQRVTLDLPEGDGPAWAREVCAGAGFTVGRNRIVGEGRRRWSAQREFALPDHVGPGMRILIVGLNPSEYAAEHGVGFARPGNRFWPAALRAGLASVDRDPVAALVDHGTGMTDLVKRPTRAAAEVTPDEFRAGGARLARLVARTGPGVVCVLGITGWRAAVDRTAVVGAQPEPLGGRPVYVMPNPSGLNAHDTVDSLADHLRRAVSLGERTAGVSGRSRGAPGRGPRRSRR